MFVSGPRPVWVPFSPSCAVSPPPHAPPPPATPVAYATSRHWCWVSLRTPTDSSSSSSTTSQASSRCPPLALHRFLFLPALLTVPLLVECPPSLDMSCPFPRRRLTRVFVLVRPPRPLDSLPIRPSRSGATSVPPSPPLRWGGCVPPHAAVAALCAWEPLPGLGRRPIPRRVGPVLRHVAAPSPQMPRAHD